MKTLGLLAIVATRVTSCDPVGHVDAPGSRHYDAISYSLNGQFDWATRQLHASEVITLATNPGEELVELDARVDVHAVHVGQVDLAFAVDSTRHTLTVDLRPLAGVSPVSFVVEYEASAVASDVLNAVTPQDNDPVRARVLFTDSEPDRASGWLVAKVDPSDRAQFGVNLIVERGEDVVANGQRMLDLNLGPHRLVSYFIDQPLPTYLMAFAAGELVHEDDESDSGVPLSLWHRRGLVVDAPRHLDVVKRAMATFERLLGPYPFDRYSVVLAPHHPAGGMENATITFNDETSGMGVVEEELNAHELSHHWFGDWVTMRRYQDLWIKEGMATLLQQEVMRASRDPEHTGRFFGSTFYFSPRHAIVDPTLTGLARYTSGPYGRAAWQITQIRVLVGEQVFWSSLRRFLDEQALGSADGETFLRYFQPALDEATLQSILANLERFETPTIDVAAPGGDPSTVTFTLDDPLGRIIAPIGITVVDASGAASTSAMRAGVPLTVSVPPGGYLAPDEADVHPPWGYSYRLTGNYYGLVLPLLVPTSPAALVEFERRSPAQQERAMGAGGPAELAPEQVGPLYAQLDSPWAQRDLIYAGCAALSFVAGDAAQEQVWMDALAPLLQAAPDPHFDPYSAGCPVVLTTPTLLPELLALATATDTTSVERLEYLLSFDYGSAASLAAIGRVAIEGATGKLRAEAVVRLEQQIQAPYQFTPVPDEERGAWREFFRARLAETTSAGTFVGVWQALVGLADVEAAPLAAPFLHTEMLSARSQRSIVCQAFKLTSTAPALWTAFQAAAQPWATLDAAAQAVLADPTPCPH